MKGGGGGDVQLSSEETRSVEWEHQQEQGMSFTLHRAGNPVISPGRGGTGRGAGFTLLSGGCIRFIFPFKSLTVSIT